MKILLTGKNGQVGFELRRALAPLGEIVAVDMAECDLSNADAIRSLVREVAPQVIVNPAAYTAVDKAETDQATANAVNAVAPGVFGQEAKKLGRWSCITRRTTSSTARSRVSIRKMMRQIRKVCTARPNSRGKRVARQWRRLPDSPYQLGGLARTAAILPKPCCAWRPSAMC
jgi:NAD(P)-dependent dehydrogenase (short-subunit alcohol dehydrogenase family)